MLQESAKSFFAVAFDVAMTGKVPLRRTCRMARRRGHQSASFTYGVYVHAQLQGQEALADAADAP